MENYVLLSQFLESDSDSDTELIINYDKEKQNEVNLIMKLVAKTPLQNLRVCIESYMELVVANYSETEFRSHFRISRSLFDSLSEDFSKSSVFKNLRPNINSISPNLHVAVFLWFAGHEACCFRDVADRFNLSLSSVNRVITRMITYFSNMAPSVIKWPDEEKKVATSTFFLSKCQFPGVIGCIDGTHIVIDPPKDRKDDYIDRKGNVTLILQAVCNANKKFIDVFIGYPGSSHDSWVFKNSPLFTQLEAKCRDYYILGDSAYPCLKNLLTPYKDNGRLTAAQIRYNVKLSSGRVCIEHAFGIMKQRFRQLYYCKLRGIKRLCHFIRACCVLHNIANETDLDFIVESGEEPHNLDVNYDREVESGNCVRNLVCNQLPPN